MPALAAGGATLTSGRALALVVVAIGLLIGVAASPTAADEPDPFAPILHALDYLAVDYPGAVKDGKVLDQGEYAEHGVRRALEVVVVADRLALQDIRP